MTSPAEDSPEWRQLAEWFERASALPPNEQDAFICNAPLTEAMRRELASLLSHAPRAERFFGKLEQAVSASTSHLETEAAGEPDQVPGLPGTTIAHYRITAELGRGGMGVVYHAIDERLQRPVALKLLYPRRTTHGSGHIEGHAQSARESAEARAKAKLLREARAIASLDHPNICTVYDVGETDDHVPYIAMAHYAGETLEALLARGPLPIATALDYAAQIARGLSAAHARGIVHRDVKPANVLVSDQGILKLLDFGIARDLTGEGLRTTPQGFASGTVCYMSPEQVSDTAIDQRTDLWSLGVVLHEMCAGTRPFVTRNVGGLLYDIAYAAAPPLRSVRDDVPSSVQRIVSRLLEKNVAQRYQRADDVVRDLTQPPEANAESAPKSEGGWVTRLMARLGHG